MVLSYFKIWKVFLNGHIIYPNLCAFEFERNRIIATVKNSFICFHRFNDEISSIYFVSKFILQFNFPAIITRDEIKKTMISRQKKKQVHEILCRNTSFIS